MNRRHFFLSTLAGTYAARRAVAASDKVTIAFMGVGGRGLYQAKIFSELPDVNVAYICDVDRRRHESAAKVVEAAKGKRPAIVTDLRRVLEDKSVDGIVMATPIHWHAPGTLLAVDAGKDVYVEKPASHNIMEGQWMLQAARRTKRIVQIGSQSRSRPVTQRFVEYVKSGKIGRVLMAKVMNCQMRRNIGRLPDEPVPPEVDYDAWTGPVPLMPFNRNRFHGTVNWHWHYGGGDLCNDGVHWVDIACWVLDAGYPLEASGMGCKLYFDDDQQTPDTQNISYRYKDKVIQYEQRLWNNYMLEGSENTTAVYGTDGYAQVGRWNGGRHAFRVFDNNNKQVHWDEEPTPDGHLHHRNFIDCIKSRKLPNADIELGHISATVCHLGNIVTRTGRNVKFDGKSLSIVGDAEANRLVRREYRKHWSTPKEA